MKQFFLLLVMSMAVTVCFAQPKPGSEVIIGKLKLPTGLKAQLSYKVFRIDTTYNFTYKDMRFKQAEVFKNIRFTNLNDVITFYALLKDVFVSGTGKKKKEAGHYVGTNEIFLKGMNAHGEKRVRISVDDAYTILSEEEVDTIFALNPHQY